MRYEANEKHHRPFQPGRSGSIWPSDMTAEEKARLLAESSADPNGGRKRYATDGQRAFCAAPHAEGEYHGWPVGWKEVPESLRRTFRAERQVTRRAIQLYWEGEPASWRR